MRGVNLTVQDLLRQDAWIQDLYFNISEITCFQTPILTILNSFRDHFSGDFRFYFETLYKIINAVVGLILWKNFNDFSKNYHEQGFEIMQFSGAAI